MAITEREQLWLNAITASRKAMGLPVTEKEAAELIIAVQVILPIWDHMMPLLVSDIVKAVKKEMLYAA